MNQISLVFIFVYSINGLSTNYVKIREYKENVSKDSFGESAEKDIHNNLEEIRSKFQSAENKIPLSSGSSSMENMTNDQKIKRRRWKNINTSEKNIITDVEEIDQGSTNSGKILSSDEESKRLWDETPADNKLQIEYQTLENKSINDITQTNNKKPNRLIETQSGIENLHQERQAKNYITESKLGIQAANKNNQTDFVKFESLVETVSINQTKHQGMQIENDSTEIIENEAVNDTINQGTQTTNEKTQADSESDATNRGMQFENGKTVNSSKTKVVNYTKNQRKQTANEKTESLTEAKSENEAANIATQTENFKTERLKATENGTKKYNHGMQSENEKIGCSNDAKPGKEINNQEMCAENKTDTKIPRQKETTRLNDDIYDENKYPVDKQTDPESYDDLDQESDRDYYVDEEIPCPLAKMAQMHALLKHMNLEEMENQTTHYGDNQTSSNGPNEMRRKMRPQRQLFSSPSNPTAPTNSTIEVSDHNYQENINAGESEDEGALVDYPYSVSVQRKGAHYASGALVGERWVLSTAAEFYNVRETIKLFRMRLGSVDCKKGGLVTPVKSIAIYPGFIPGQPSYDVSLLGMARPVTMSNVIKPIGLSRVAGKVMSAKFLTTYWPRIVVKKGVVPPTAKERVKFNSMRVSTQKLVPSDKCSKMLAAVNASLACASLCLRAVKVHHSDCMPDVGAPVVAVDGLWGITSGWISPLCPAQPLPTVFTRVSVLEVRTWIEEQMTL